jgi:DNA-binding PadR family transcriptional regulator
LNLLCWIPFQGTFPVTKPGAIDFFWLISIRDNLFYVKQVYIYVRNTRKNNQGKQMKEMTVSEGIVLTAIWRLKEHAYGISVRKKVVEVTGREIAYGTLYNILDQLVRKGYVSKRLGQPVAKRGGRSKIYYRLTKAGVQALQDAHKLQKKIWEGLPELTGEEG